VTSELRSPKKRILGDVDRPKFSTGFLAAVLGRAEYTISRCVVLRPLHLPLSIPLPYYAAALCDKERADPRGARRAVYDGWVPPLEGRSWLFDEDVDLSDPWQFENFRVR